MELPISYQVFNSHLESVAIANSMVVVFVEFTIFGSVPGGRISFQSPGIAKHAFVFDFHKDLLSQSVQWSEGLEPFEVSRLLVLFLEFTFLMIGLE